MGLAQLLGRDSGSSGSPADVARRRALAQQLLQGSSVQNAGILGALSNGLGGALSGYELSQAANAETTGREGYTSKMAAMLANPDAGVGDLAGLASDPWATDSQSSVVNALLGRKMEMDDPMRALDMQYKQAQIDAANAKPGQPLINAGDHLIYDPNTKEWITPPTDGMAAADPKGEGNLRGEYNGINTVKDFGLQTQAYQRVLDSAKDPSPAGDLALIFNYMKVLDPGSTVREGEFATAQNSGSIPEQLMAQYNKIVTGERLVPEIRADFVNRAGQLYKGASGLQEQTNNRYSDIASQYGYDPERIVAPVPQIGVLDPEFDVSEYLNPSTGEQTKPIPLTPENADAEYEALPSGTQFIGPDGIPRVKP